MRKTASTLLVALGLVVTLGGCAQEQIATKKANGYNSKISTADIVFVDNPKFYEDLKGTQSGSMYISGMEVTQSLEDDLTAFSQRISTDLPTKVAPDINGKVSKLIPAELSQVRRTNPKLLIIRPVGARTTCKPCYSVVTFRVDVYDANWSRTAPVWQTETRLVISKPDSVQALWSTISGALRTDDLLPAATPGKPAVQ